MKTKYYYKTKAIYLYFSVLILIISFVYVPINFFPKIIISVIGIILGLLFEKYDWKKFKNRIDERNIVIEYKSESIFFVILILLFIVQFTPRTLFQFVNQFEFFQMYVFILVFLLISLNTGYLFLQYKLIKEYELDFGKLIPKKFWSKSVVGQEGMLLKIGFVTVDCNPLGKVKIDGEIWNAKSIDEINIESGNKVQVKDINGLQLIVKKYKLS